MSNRVLETYESRHRHKGSIRLVSPIWENSTDGRTGFVYGCPRCDFVAPTMKYRQGAERRGDEHALECLAGK
jgi:hypothetical protein